jgi:glycerol uptake facilitator-like aquaporin
MFGMPLLQASTHVRSTIGEYLGEFVASAGLLMVVVGHRRARDAPWMIAAWIGAAYWFTSSTSFANPAITIARSLTDSFSGIRPLDVPAFVCAQLAGAVAGAAVARLIFDERRPGPAADSRAGTPHHMNQASR